MEGGHAKPKQHGSILDLLRRHGNKEEKAHEAAPRKLPVAREVKRAEALDLVPFATEQVHLQGGLVLLKGKASAIAADAPTTFAHSDLVAGQYEGGFKLWECSVDLIEAVQKEIQDGHLSFRGKDVLELGCGHGLPGIFACVKGAACVHFQDFNESVLLNLTMSNLEANLAAAEAEHSAQEADPWHAKPGRGVPSAPGVPKGATPGVPEQATGRGKAGPGAPGAGAPGPVHVVGSPEPEARGKAGGAPLVGLLGKPHPHSVAARAGGAKGWPGLTVGIPEAQHLSGPMSVGGRGMPSRPRTPKCPHPQLRTKFIAGDWGDVRGLVSLAERRGSLGAEKPSAGAQSVGTQSAGAQSAGAQSAGAQSAVTAGAEAVGDTHRRDTQQGADSRPGDTGTLARDGHVSAAADVAPARDAPGEAPPQPQQGEDSAGIQPTHASPHEPLGPTNSAPPSSTTASSGAIITNSTVAGSSSLPRTSGGAHVWSRDEHPGSSLAYHKVLEGSPAFSGKGEEYLKGRRLSGGGGAGSEGGQGEGEEEGGYDIILTSETVYSTESIPKLLALVKACLRRPYGVLYLAGKKYYFGVGGGTRRFVDAVKEDGTLHGHLLTEIADGASNVREVWKFFYKP